MRNPRVKDRLLEMLLNLVARERAGEMIPRGLIKTITGMLFELGQEVYSKDFEQPFLQRSADFYKIESNEYLAQNSAPDYMKKAEQRLHEEEDRVSHYLDARTEPKIKEVNLAPTLALTLTLTLTLTLILALALALALTQALTDLGDGRC